MNKWGMWLLGEWMKYVKIWADEGMKRILSGGYFLQTCLTFKAILMYIFARIIDTEAFKNSLVYV